MWRCKVRGHEKTGCRGDPLTDDDQLYCHNVLVVNGQWVQRTVIWSQSSDCECCARHIQAAPLFEQTLITLTSQNKTCWIPNNKISFTYLCTDGNNQIPFRPSRRRGWSHLSRRCCFCWREDRLAVGRHRRPLFCTVSRLQRRKTSLAPTFLLAEFTFTKFFAFPGGEGSRNPTVQYYHNILFTILLRYASYQKTYDWPHQTESS